MSIRLTTEEAKNIDLDSDEREQRRLYNHIKLLVIKGDEEDLLELDLEYIKPVIEDMQYGYSYAYDYKEIIAGMIDGLPLYLLKALFDNREEHAALNAAAFKKLNK